MKRAEFISKSTDIRGTFSFASPVEVLRAVKVFAGDLYGANLWNLGGALAEQVYKAWTTCIKLTWNVSRVTHTYFMDMLLGCGISHVRTDILARYVNFLKSLHGGVSACEYWWKLSWQNFWSREGRITFQMMDTVELTDLIDSLCVS